MIPEIDCIQSKKEDDDRGAKNADSMPRLSLIEHLTIGNAVIKLRSGLANFPAES